jgi:hypothetical protein
MEKKKIEPEDAEQVTPPPDAPIAPGVPTLALVAVGAGIGASIAGTPGAMVGGTVGWAVDAVRRRLMR